MAANHDTAYGKLLDAWTAPEGAGEPVGCIATSFTFDAVFFEEECLGRFLRLESDAIEDGPIYLLEREEKLAQLRGAIALVDQHNCQGKRSLRWDLVPVRVAGGIMHAKISLLHWSQCVRMVIASANLTKNGYRLNQEVFGVIDFSPGAAAPLKVLTDTLGFLRRMAEGHVSTDIPVQGRLENLLAGIEQAVAAWDIRTDRSVRLGTVFVAPGLPNAMAQLETLWPESSPPSSARVLSPFFDRETGTINRPATALWDLLRKRGRTRVEFHVTGEDANDAEDSLLLHAPESLLKAQPDNRGDVATDIKRVAEDDGRPLHAKSIWLRGASWYLYMLGSSNFTSHGLGLAARTGAAGKVNSRVNAEANLVYMVNHKRQAGLARSLRSAFLEGDSISAERWLKWLPTDEAGEDAPDETTLPLLKAFVSAIYRYSPDSGAVVSFEVVDPPPSWQIINDVDERVVCKAGDAATDGASQRYEIPWTDLRPPSGFWVAWKDTGGRAWWPVNIESQAALPPPEDLKDLPLEVLIDILTSARPLHRNMTLRRYLKRRGEKGKGNDAPPELDPHRRVDTSRFLLQRTRRVGWALTALRERLQRPVYSQESLGWRLSGPVGVTVLAEALTRDARSDEEKAFLIAELALELHRVEPVEAQDALPAAEVKAAVRSIASELRASLPAKLKATGPLGSYVTRVFDEVTA